MSIINCIFEIYLEFAFVWTLVSFRIYPFYLVAIFVDVPIPILSLSLVCLMSDCISSYK